MYKILGSMQAATLQTPTPQPTFNYHAESMFKITDHPSSYVQFTPEDPNASFFHRKQISSNQKK